MARSFLFYLLALLSIFPLLIHYLSLSSAADESHFEGFDDDEDLDSASSLHLTDLPLRLSPPPTITHSNTPTTPQQSSSLSSETPQKRSSFEYWDEDEFEGLPIEPPPETSKFIQNATLSPNPKTNQKNPTNSRSYIIEIICGSFLITFTINYFKGKRENENIALAWVKKFASKDSIFEKNFSLLGLGGEGKNNEDSPLLSKEGHNVFRFYASGRRYCEGLLATMELKSRHDLISRLFNVVMPCNDEIKIEVYMNEERMDQVVFAMGKKKVVKGMHKEERDLQRFTGLVGQPQSNRKWVMEELGIVSESKEVAGDLITEAVLEQVFGDKAFEKYGKGFISMHFSDQHIGTHKKMLVFKFALPGADHMADMTRLVALVPYYIDLIGRYKLSSQARTKTAAARQKVALEAYKEFQNARQEALQKKKVEQRKLMEEAEAKLGADAILRKKEAKERARQMKKAKPKVKMTRGH